MNRRKLGLSIFLVLLISLSYIPLVHSYYYYDSFEDGITDFWVIEELYGTIETASWPKYLGDVVLNATSWSSEPFVNAYVWTDNFTSGWAQYNYQGLAIYFHSNFHLDDTKIIYLSAMWNENATWSFVKVRNSSGSLRWYPDDRGDYGDPIELNRWYWIVDGYFINSSGGSGWERLWVQGELVMDYERDTSAWEHTTGITGGIRMIYGTAVDGGTVFFDYFVFSSTFIEEPSEEYDPRAHVDQIFELMVPMMGVSGFVLLIGMFPMIILASRKKGMHAYDVFAYAFIMLVLGVGFIVVWLWG